MYMNYYCIVVNNIKPMACPPHLSPRDELSREVMVVLKRHYSIERGGIWYMLLLILLHGKFLDNCQVSC